MNNFSDNTATGNGKKYRFAEDGRFRALVMISILVAAACLALNIMNPPFDGDSYEYAGVAANLVEDGQLRLDHIRVYHVPGQTIPQPAWNRATLWTFILAPFHAIFGRSYLTFLVPFLITLLMFAPAVYLFAKKIFSEEVAFCAAAASLLNPRVLHWSFAEDPGQPELFLVIITLAATGYFLERRGAWSGIAAGLALLTRMTGALFLPLFLLWQALFRRKEIFKPYVILFAAFFILASSPLFIRNKIVFGDFMYSDQSASVLSGGEQLANLVEHPSLFDIAFKYRFAEEMKTIKRGFTPSQFARFIKANARTYLFGHHNGMAWYPGVIGLITLLMAPFVIYGAALCMRHSTKSIVVFYPAVFLALMIALRPGYEDRYIFPVIPFLMMLGFHGALELQKKFSPIKPMKLLIVFLLLETIPAALISSFVTASESKEPRYAELKAACDFIKSETPEDAVMMTIPFWSPQYVCDRPTVPPVKGDLATFKTVVDEFNVDYFMFSEYWGGDRFPKYDFMTPVMRGKYISLYKIDRGSDSYANMLREYGYMKDFDFLNYFWEKPLSARIDFRPEYLFSRLTKNPALGLLAYVICGFAIFAACGAGNKPFKIFLCAAIVILIAGFEVAALKGLSSDFNMTAPDASLFQSGRLLGAIKKENGSFQLKILDNGPEAKRMAERLSKGGDQEAELTPTSEIRIGARRAVIFVPVKEKSVYINSAETAREARKNAIEEIAAYESAAELVENVVLYPYVVSGGVAGTPRKISGRD